MRIAELERENKRLALQVEVLSAAFANSSEREKELMAEKSELIDVLYRANAHLGTIVGTDNKTPLPITFLKRQHKEFLEVLKKYQNPADLDEF